MSLNWKEINLILEELNLPGMQIQKAFQSAYDVLALELYGASNPAESSVNGGSGFRSRLVLICLSPLACRLHETFRAVPKSEKPLRFAELLKSRIVNSRIEEAVQLGDNRIVRFRLKRGENRYFLYIRLWSNAANVILTAEDGKIIDAMRRLPKRGEISGGIYRPDFPAERGNPERSYTVREFPGAASFNRGIDGWYAEHGGTRSLEQLREEVRRHTGKNRARLEAALERLREKETDYAHGSRFREYGDLILSAAGAGGKKPDEPVGETWLETKSFGGGETIRIELDPKKSLVQNAEACYERYRKAKNGLGELREEIAAGSRELERLVETEKRLLEEDNPLRLQGLLKKIRRGNSSLSLSADRGGAEAARKRPGLSFADGDWLILVGRDAAENDELFRRHAKGNDLWLHVRDRAGSYVFIKNRPGKTVPLDILFDAGNLALFYSKGRNDGRGDLYYTQVKYLRRAKNGPKGLVLPTQEKNLRIVLDQNRLKKLEKARL